MAFDDHAAYLRSQDAIKLQQLAKGGARLAEILKQDLALRRDPTAILPTDNG